MPFPGFFAVGGRYNICELEKQEEGEEMTALALLAEYLRDHGFSTSNSKMFGDIGVHTGVFLTTIGCVDTDIFVTVNCQRERFDVHSPGSFPEIIACLVKWNAKVNALEKLCDGLKNLCFKVEKENTFEARVSNGAFWMPIKLTDRVGVIIVGGVVFDMNGAFIEKILKYLRHEAEEARSFMARAHARA